MPTLQSTLADLVLHLDYDSGVRGSKFTDKPVGHLALSEHPEALWKAVQDLLAQPSDGDPEIAILKELADALKANTVMMGNPPQPVGILDIRMIEGSLWKRAVDTLGYMPDMIRDVVGPVIKARMED